MYTSPLDFRRDGSHGWCVRRPDGVHSEGRLEIAACDRDGSSPIKGGVDAVAEASAELGRVTAAAGAAGELGPAAEARRGCASGACAWAAPAPTLAGPRPARRAPGKPGRRGWATSLTSRRWGSGRGARRRPRGPSRWRAADSRSTSGVPLGMANWVGSHQLRVVSLRPTEVRCQEWSGGGEPVPGSAHFVDDEFGGAACGAIHSDRLVRLGQPWVLSDVTYRCPGCHAVRP
jgi:hypothetical protein